MKNKFIKKEELDKYFLSKEDIHFVDTSPTKDITFPPRTVIAAFHIDRVAGARNTLYVMRHDTNDTVLLNIDAYSFKSSLEYNIPLQGPFNPPGDHHTNAVPSVLGLLPEKYSNRIDQIRRGNLSDSNFLS